MRFSLFLALSLTLLPALADGQPAPAAEAPEAVTTRPELAPWLTLLRDYVPVLQAGIDALAQVNAPGTGEAALPAIRAVQAGDDAIREAARAIEAGRSYPDDFLERAEVVQAMQALPVGRYHAERARILRAGCYGDAALYLALTNQESRFTPGQVAAPISEAERATLDRMQEVNRLLAAVRTDGDSSKAGVALLPLVRDISAALPGMNPAALCEAERLRQETDSHITRLSNNYLLESRLLDALLLQPGSCFADSFMTWRGQFAVQGLVEHPYGWGADWPSCKQRCDEYRQAHAEAAAAFCQAHGLAGGDGTTPDTAFRLTRRLHPAEYRALMMRFGQEVLGEEHVPFLGETIRQRKDGRACRYVAGNAGHTGDTNHNHDQTILVPYYFLLP